MSRSLRALLVAVVGTALLLTTAVNALAGGRKVLDSTMVGIPTGGLALYGVAGGGLPWVLDSGKATLFADGRLHVEVEGLVLAVNHTNPIRSGRAIVTCAGAPAASTDPVFFSPEG